MKSYSTVRGWLVRMVQHSLGGKFDELTGRKRILGPQILKKIMEWTCRDPSGYGFGQVSWHLDIVNEMIRRETGRHAKPCTLRRILHHLGHSYSKPRPVPRKTAPAEEQNMFKEMVKKTIVGVSGHGYALPAVDVVGVMRGTSPEYGWCQAKNCYNDVPQTILQVGWNLKKATLRVEPHPVHFSMFFYIFHTPGCCQNPDSSGPSDVPLRSFCCS